MIPPSLFHWKFYDLTVLLNVSLWILINILIFFKVLEQVIIMDILTTKQDDWDALKITHTFSPEVLGELNLITSARYVFSSRIMGRSINMTEIAFSFLFLLSLSLAFSSTLWYVWNRKVTAAMWFCQTVSMWSSEKNGRWKGSGIWISLRNVTMLLSCVAYLNNQGAPWAPWSNSGRNWGETVRFLWKH